MHRYFYVDTRDERKTSTTGIKIRSNPVERLSARRRDITKFGLRFNRNRTSNKSKSVTNSPQMVSKIKRSASAAGISTDNDMAHLKKSERRPSEPYNLSELQDTANSNKCAISKFSILAESDINLFNVEQQFDEAMKSLEHSPDESSEDVGDNDSRHLYQIGLSNGSMKGYSHNNGGRLGDHRYKTSTSHANMSTDDGHAIHSKNLQALHGQMVSTWDTVAKMNEKINLMSDEIILLAKNVRDLKELISAEKQTTL